MQVQIKKKALGAAAAGMVFIGLFVTVIGPWPVYNQYDIHDSEHYRVTVDRLHSAGSEIAASGTPGTLYAGWSVRDMTPQPGTPMAGYSGRRDGKRSEGVRDPLKARAVAVSDGGNTVVILGTDMLFIPPGIAEKTIKAVYRKTRLSANDIFFTATHTHCGPGGFMRGLAARITGGPYDPEIPEFLAGVFADAVIEAYESLAPARLAHGSIDAGAFIRNRARSGGPVDRALDYMVIEREDGDRCFITRFSAHPTVFRSDMMKFSAGFPGEMVRYIEEETGATAVYLGGGVGSMRPSTSHGGAPEERVAALGRSLGSLVVEAASELDFLGISNVASLSVPVETPQLQLRPVSPNWRLSPLAVRMLGIRSEGRLQAARIGNIQLVGLPFDVSGELAAMWRDGIVPEDNTLWITSFSPGYLGYLSPGEYYDDVDGDGRLGYEIGIMNWLGPNSAQYFESLIIRAIKQLNPGDEPELLDETRMDIIEAFQCIFACRMLHGAEPV